MTLQNNGSQLEKIDLLLVINQDAPLDQILKYLNDARYRRAILLSSHFLFSLERERILKSLTSQSRVKFLCFANVLKEEDLLASDKFAVEKLDSLKDKRYSTLIMKWHMLHDKNRRIYQELQSIYSIDKVVSLVNSFYGYSLGVSARYWSKVGKNDTVFTIKDKLKEFNSSVMVSGVFHRLDMFKKRIGLIFNTIELRYIQEDDTIFVFNSLKRLSIEEQAKVQSLNVRMNLSNKLRFLISPWTFVLKPRLKKIADEQEISFENLYWCAPVHEYHQPLDVIISRTIQHKLLIFQDAFRPSNYPPYYVHSLWYGRLVPRDMFDAKLFERFGRQRFARPDFLCSDKMVFFNHDQEHIKTKTVILSLNYAGDWTALINRSDTDVLIQAFSDLALSYPLKDFIIRLHPKMHLVANAEGKHSRNRVESFIRDLALSNLQVSQESLETDWERGDVFISEYSLSVIDAIKQGKIGFFVNPTDRMSFMEDYVKLGFVEVPIARMKPKLQEIFDNPNRFYTAQIEAMQAYNYMYEAFHAKS